MSKIKEEEVRQQLLKILPDYFETEGSGRVKVRIYEIDRLVDYFLKAYHCGYEEGKNRVKIDFKKIINRL